MNLIKLKSNLQMWYISCLVYLKKYVSTRNCKSNEVRANLKGFVQLNSDDNIENLLRKEPL